MMNPLALLRRMLAKEAPAQQAQAARALRRTAATGNETSVVGSAREGTRGVISEGMPDRVQPDFRDISLALSMAREGSPAFDFHTHPSTLIPEVVFVNRPSSMDFEHWLTNYPEDMLGGQELRTMVAVPPSRKSKTSSGYTFFATDKPSREFDPSRLADAVGQLQLSGHRGKFDSVRVDPRFRAYFDDGGDLADVMESIAPLSLFDLAQSKGRGRFHTLVPRGVSLTPNYEATEDRLYEMLLPLTVENLRSKGFKSGGLARYKECACHGL